MGKLNNDKPPILGSWNAWYSVVIIFLIALILFFYYLTKKFS